MNFQAPAPFAVFQTRSGTFTADASGIISGVSAVSGTAAQDLVASGCTPITSSSFANFRNIIDGGDFTVNPWQRNTTSLGSSNTIAAAISNTVTYFPDRWFAVGGASSSILLGQSADTTVPGFSQSCFMSRSSGNSNTAAINFGHVIETLDAVKLQGQAVTLSFWARTGANYSGGVLTVLATAGTGTNQAASNMVAGSWTNQSNVINTTQALTGTMTRYSFTGIVPPNATQMGALLTWTPSGTAGAADGIFFNGMQLEVGSGLSPFEHRDVQVELEICQRYAWAIPEPAANVIVGAGMNTTSAIQIFYMATPVQLFKAPTVTVSAGTFKTNQASTATATTITAGTTHTPNAISVNGNSAGVAGQGTLLMGGGGTGYILASSDF